MKEYLELTVKEFLGLTVIAAIVTTCGTLLGLFLKDFLFVYYFDRLKETRTLEKIAKKYKDPILLSAEELFRRITDFIEYYSFYSVNSTLEVLFDKSDKMTSGHHTDRYFLRYSLTSTIYRFCAFFGWLELFRQEITFLDSHSKNRSFRYLKLLSKVREAVADGQLNSSPDWESWYDPLIFREELRAVGEGMLESGKEQKSIIGYGKFQQIIRNYETSKEPTWLPPVITFFTDFKHEKDFRTIRFKLLKEALDDLMIFLNKDYYQRRIKNTSYSQSIKQS